MITVRDVALLGRERRDDVSEGRQRLVDGLRFLELLASRSALLDPLASGQIDERKLAARHALCLEVRGFDLHGDDEVRPRGLPVHLRGRHMAPLLASLDGVHELSCRVHGYDRGSRDSHNSLRIFLDIQLNLLLFVAEKVLEVVDIQLEHAHRDLGRRLARLPLQDLEELTNTARGQSRQLVVSVDGERFPGPRLAVGEDTHVVPIDRTLDQVLGVREHSLLVGFSREDSIKGELPLLVLPVEVNGQLVGEVDGHLLPAVLLKLKQRADSAVHPNLPLHVLHGIVQLLPGDGLLFVQLFKLV
mmetsp:Transcript_1021/g.3104  ORF Transcript_1021/g.3104 Transcript_1021/m.3104 type:complete len:302 (+) Transcript_1021:366-1271(+)